MIFDGHCDIFTDVLRRRLAGEENVLQRRHLPLLRAGGISGGCFVLWVDPPYTDAPAERLTQLMQAVEAEMAVCTEAVLVHHSAEMRQAQAEGRFPILLGVEGLAAIGEDISDIERLYAFGVRHAMLTWNEENALATGAKGNPARGLTDAGRRAVRCMEKLQMLVDVSHLNEASFWDVLRVAQAPVIASHSNAYALAAVPRNLTDEQLRAIAKTGGLVGLNANKNLVSPDPAKQHLRHFAAHAAHIAETIGVEHLAFGFDFNEYLTVDATKSYNDGGNPNVPGLEDASHTPAYLVVLREVGFSQKELQQMAEENWLRLIETVIG
ncbi:MAG: membrane dipeptidase [Peptococcaceae bacterium]|nr:membrane dipeptidase [Peptococcaceae bacterium]